MLENDRVYRSSPYSDTGRIFSLQVYIVRPLLLALYCVVPFFSVLLVKTKWSR